MKKTYPIDVDCANCALLMEMTAAKVEGVESVIVNYMIQKMIVTFQPGLKPDDVMPKVVKACKKAVPDGTIDY